MPALIGFGSVVRSRHSAAVFRWPKPVKRRPRSLVISAGPGEYLPSARPSRSPRRLSPNQRRQLKPRKNLSRIRRQKHHRQDRHGPDQDRLPAIRAGGSRPLARNRRRQKRKLPRLRRKNQRKKPPREKRSPPLAFLRSRRLKRSLRPRSLRRLSRAHD